MAKRLWLSIWLFLAVGPAAVINAQTVSLQLDASLGGGASRVKVLPDGSCLAFAGNTGLVHKFDADGRVNSVFKSLDHRTADSEHSFFDFAASSDGQIFVLGMFKDQNADLKAGVFVFRPDGSFDRLTTLSKKMDARGITVGPNGNLFILGLPPDFYFGKSKKIHLLHKFTADGEYVGSGAEVNPSLLAPDGNVQHLYHTLRANMDRIPIGSCPRGIFSVMPGTHTLHFYDPGTLALLDAVQLQVPSFPSKPVPVGLQDRYGEYQGNFHRIREIQVGAQEIRSEFVHSQTYRKPNAFLNSRFLVITDAKGKMKSSRETVASYRILVGLASSGYSRFCTLSLVDNKPVLMFRD